MVKFENRFEAIYRSFVIQSKMVSNHKDKIVYVVTHFDHAESPKEFSKEFNNYLSSKKIDNQVIYMSNTRFNQKKICDTFYSIGYGMSQ